MALMAFSMEQSPRAGSGYLVQWFWFCFGRSLPKEFGTNLKAVDSLLSDTFFPCLCLVFSG